jgi:hypothetical protein
MIESAVVLHLKLWDKENEKKKEMLLLLLLNTCSKKRIYFDHRTVLKWFDVLSMLLWCVYKRVTQSNRFYQNSKIDKKNTLVMKFS